MVDLSIRLWYHLNCIDWWSYITGYRSLMTWQILIHMMIISGDSTIQLCLYAQNHQNGIVRFLAWNTNETDAQPFDWLVRYSTQRTSQLCAQHAPLQCCCADASHAILFSYLHHVAGQHFKLSNGSCRSFYGWLGCSYVTCYVSLPNGYITITLIVNRPDWWVGRKWDY